MTVNDFIQFVDRVRREFNDVYSGKKKVARAVSADRITGLDAFEIDEHIHSPHAPSNAQKNSDITKSEIETKLNGIINSHYHAVGFSDISVSQQAIDSFNSVLRTMKSPESTLDLIGEAVSGWIREAEVNGLLDKHYIHEQIQSSQLWTVVHNLGKLPSVTIVDSSGGVVYGPDVRYINSNCIEISTDAPFSGRAILS